MNINKEKLAPLAKDLTKEFPRSPRAMLGGYVLAARCIDKCRAILMDKGGEYHYACPLDQQFLQFAEIDPDKLKEVVASGASDEELGEWIKKNAKQKSKEEVVVWNNNERELKLSSLPPEKQAWMEDYISQYVPEGKVIYRFFDIFDYEEGRL